MCKQLRRAADVIIEQGLTGNNLPTSVGQVIVKDTRGHHEEFRRQGEIQLHFFKLGLGVPGCEHKQELLNFVESVGKNVTR